MTHDEMQRYLIQQAQRGETELNAYRNLMIVLGLEYPTGKQEEKKED